MRSRLLLTSILALAASVAIGCEDDPVGPLRDVASMDASPTSDSTPEVTPPSLCGNGILELGEECDGDELGGASCEAFGELAGTVSCSPTCNLDRSACSSAPPPGWTCSPSRYGDPYCDCGCGVVDIDCADAERSSCDFCASAGSCNLPGLACPGVIAENDNATCFVPSCGNDTAEGFELCDGADLAGLACSDWGFDGGTVTCANDCESVSLAGCTTTATCGDHLAEGPERCDGSDLAGENCATLGFEAGVLACADDCSDFDLSACNGGEIPGWRCAPERWNDGFCDCGCGVIDRDCNDSAADRCYTCDAPGSCADPLRQCRSAVDLDNSGLCGNGGVCGNSIVEPGEECDRTQIGDFDCLDLGFAGGDLVCSRGCKLDTSKCEPFATCGDGLAEGVEVCDGTDVRGGSCQALGFVGGSLVCNGDCTGLSTAGCHSCGNDFIDAGELCDTNNLSGETCQTFGFDGGDLACSFDCSGYDTSECTGTVDLCGNGVVDPFELCDGLDLAGADCVTQGFTSGSLTCAFDCQSYDESFCTGGAVCGDNLAEAIEPCDGTDLRGLDCTAFGFTGGSLACSNCELDSTGCTGGAPTEWTCSPGFYGDGDCDCGCGALDSDCTDDTVSACDWCDDSGSCDEGGGGCPGTIDPNQNWLCAP